MRDFHEIRKSHPINELAARYGFRLTSTGRGEWKGKCQIHGERKGEAFTVFTADDGTQRWKCHGKCQAGGDVLDLLDRVDPALADELRGGARSQGGARPAPASRQSPAEPTPPPEPSLEFVVPAPELDDPREVTAYSPKAEKRLTYRPTRVFTYRNRQGEILGHVLRIEIRGDKQFRTVQWHQELGWVFANFKKPSPLYGLHELNGRKQIVLVEGEGKRDDLQAALPKGTAVLGLYQGSKSAHLCDLSAFEGRKAILWPDADEAGFSAMKVVADRLNGSAEKVTWIDASDHGGGWDASDLIREGGSPVEYIKSRAREIEQLNPPEPTNVVRLDAKRGYADALKATEQELPEPESEGNRVFLEEHKFEPLPVRPQGTAEMSKRLKMAMVKAANGETFPRARPTLGYNHRVVLHFHPQTCHLFKWNDFTENVDIVDRPPWEPGSGDWTPRVLRDGDVLQACTWMNTKGFEPKQAQLREYIVTQAERYRYNPMVDRLNELEQHWDRQTRLDTWLHYYCGAPDTPGVRRMGLCWLIAAIARAMEPGCKMDNILILEGKQGIGKSTVFEILAATVGTQAADQISIDAKELLAEMAGVWIGEVAELHSFRAKEADALKQFLGRRRDVTRKLFSNDKLERPRRFVLAGTINPDGRQYLKDTSGSRRFWIVPTSHIDLEALTRDAPQLLGEAVAAYRAGTPWWIPEDDEVADEIRRANEGRTETDPWLALIAEQLENNVQLRAKDVLFPHEIFAWALEMRRDQIDGRAQTRLGMVMHQLGFRRARPRVSGVRVVAYTKAGGDDGAA